MTHKLSNAFSTLFSFFANLFNYENLLSAYDDENLTDEEREQLEREVFIHSTMIF